MRIVWAIGLSASLLAAACTPPASAPRGFPPEVEARIEQERQVCADGMGELEPLPLEALQEAEFNADGAPDYLLSHEAFRCTEGGNLYCGSAGCSFTVFMSQSGGGLSPVDMGNAQATTIVRDGDRDVLDLALHGRIVGADTEFARLRWNGQEFAEP